MACVEKTQVWIEKLCWKTIRYCEPGGDKSNGGQKLGIGCATEREKFPKESGDLQNAHKVVNLYKVVHLLILHVPSFQSMAFF